MKKILVVDDNPDIREMLYHYLNNEFKVEVIEKESGESAAKTLASCNIDLVLSDFQMPNGNGGWLHQFMLAQTPKTPLILFTTYLGDDLPHQDHVLKAIILKHQIDELLQALHSLGFNSKDL